MAAAAPAPRKSPAELHGRLAFSTRLLGEDVTFFATTRHGKIEVKLGLGPNAELMANPIVVPLTPEARASIEDAIRLVYEAVPSEGLEQEMKKRAPWKW